MSGIETATPTSPCGPYHAYNLADAAGAEDKARIRLDKARIRMNSVVFDRQRIGNQFRYESAITRGRFHTNYSLMSARMVELAEAYDSDLDDLPDLMSATDTDDDLPNMSSIETATPTNPCGPYHYVYNVADAAGAKARIRLAKARIRMNSGDGRCGYHCLATRISFTVQELAEAYANDLPDLLTADDTDDDLPDLIADFGG